MSPRKTRASNASKRPGLATKPAPCRTSAEVQAAAKAKEAASAAKKQAQEACIKRVAEFESNARTNEDLIDATPRPNFAPCGSQPDSDADLGTSEDDGPNPDKHTYTPPDESADESDNSMQSAEIMSVPKGKKKTTLAAAANKVTKSGMARKVGLATTKQLVTIAENVERDSEPSIFRRSDWWKGQVLEETDSNGIAPPLRYWKPKAQGRDTEMVDSKRDTEAPPSKKPKVVKNAVEQESMEKLAKKKQSIHEAITAVQQGQMGASANGNGGVSEKQAEVAAKEKVRVAVTEVKSQLRDVPKHFSDGPQWN